MMSLTLVPPPPAPPTEAQRDDWRGLLKMKGKELAQIPHNARILFKYHEDFKGFIRWNQFNLRVEVTGGPLTSCLNYENIDALVGYAQDQLAAAHDLSIGQEAIGRRLVDVAMENPYDPLKEYLDALVWDGVPRLDGWLTTYGKAAPSPDGYVSFTGRKWMISAVARAYQPGCKADVVLVLEGEQGDHKSTLCRILGGAWYAEASGVLGDKDSKQLIGTAWLIELPDMASFSKGDRNTMKAFFSSPFDRFRPPYGKVIVDILRRAVFIATTNDEEYLTDPTGNRRFAPVLLGEVDRAALIRDRDQLWAEAVAIYKSSATCADCIKAEIVVPGEPGRCYKHAWWLSPQERVIARVQTQLREEQDVWAPAVLTFTANPSTIDSGGVVPLTTSNILKFGLGCKDMIKVGTKDGYRIAAIMKRAGYRRELRGADSPWERT